MMVRNGRAFESSWLDRLREQGAIVTFLAVQAIAVIIWGARIDTRVDVLEKGQHDQDVYLNRLDERGSRSIPLLDTRIKAIEDGVANDQKDMQQLVQKMAIVPPIIQVQLDAIKDQQSRIIQALDNTYNLLNEHLRTPGNERNRPIKP